MNAQFRYHSISRNLTLGLFIAFGLVASLTLYASLRFSSRQATIELQAKAEEYITSLVDILAVPLWHFNEQVIEAIGKSYAHNDLIAALSIKGEVGNWDFTIEDPDQKTMVSRTGNITYNGEHLGTVTISMTSRYYTLLNRRFFWSYVVTLLLMIVILSLLSGGLLRQFLKKPFMQFVDLVNAYASGDKEAFSQHVSYIELQPLIAVLKQMGEKISAQMQALQQAEQKYRSIFDNAVVGIFQSTPGGRIIEANPTLARILGYDSPEELMHSITNVRQQLYVRPEQRDEFLRLVEREKIVSAFEARQYHKDGSSIWVSLSARPVYNERGNAHHYEGFLQDITARKQAEKELAHYQDHLESLVRDRTRRLEAQTIELRDAKDTAEAANRAKSIFLANMSHELRTPLSVILGFAQLIHRESNLPPTQHEHLDIILRSGEHLLTLINDVLEMSKIEAGRTSLNITSFDFWQTLRNIEEMTCIRTEKKGLQFTVSRASEVPQCIKTDESKLRQVLLNLLSNAVKFTEEGNVTLRVRRTEKRRREESNFQASSFKLQFEIEDTGIGIAPDEIDMIFEALERTQQSQRFTEGTGLGLAISRKFVQLMGGEIHVESDVGKGSVFTFDIQTEATDITEIKAEQPPRQIIGLESNQPAYRILVVEDHRESRILLTQLLRSVGFEVREATNGREALAQYASWQPHLIFMDMGMPIMDGYEATRQIQKEEEQKSQEQTKNTKHQTRTPIIALTASSFEEDRVQVLAAGCDSFVRKPFKDSEIFAIMAKHLAIRYVYEEGEEQQTKDHRQFGKEELRPETLAALPSDILDILEQATIQLNRKRIIKAIETIRPHNKLFADNLLEFVDDFQYDEILNCLRTIREKRHNMK